MRYSYLLLYILIFFASCNQNTAVVPDENELFRREIHAIDWSYVDEYPSYPKCDSVTGVEEQKMCFFKIFQKDIKQKLLQDSIFVAKKYNSDSLMINVTIFPNGVIELKAVNKQNQMNSNKELDSLLFANSSRLEEIQPAIKRGIPVKSQFELKINW